MTNRAKNESSKISIGKYVSGFHIEIDKISRAINVCVSSVVSVLNFSEEEVILKIPGCRLRVYGKGLVIRIFENQIAEVKGNVEGVVFI
jgi:hypothetical protein